MSRILVVDDELAVRELMGEALGLEGHEVVSADSAVHAVEMLLKEMVDLIILDLGLGDYSGMAVLKEIRKQGSDVPIVVYSGLVTPEVEKEARSAGATDVLRKDIGISALVRQIQQILNSVRRDKPAKAESDASGGRTILIIDDMGAIRELLHEFFTDRGYRTLLADSGETGLILARDEDVDVALLDIEMPGMDGIETLRRLKEINPGIGVVMITGNQDDEKVQQAIELGAYGYILKPFDFLYLDLVVMSRIAIAGA